MSAIILVFYEFAKALVFLTIGQTNLVSYLSMSLLACSAIEIPRNCATLATCGLFCLISFERFPATKNHENYDDKSWKFSIIGCSCVFAFAFIYSLGLLYRAVQFETFTIPFCSMGFFINGRLDADEAILLSAILALVMISAAVSVYTKRKSLQKLLNEFSANSASASLQSRFQLNHSVELTRAVLISVVLYCICYLCYDVSRLLMMLLFDVDFVYCNRIALFRLAQSLPSVVHLACHPWIVIFKCKTVRKMVLRKQTAAVAPALVDDSNQRLDDLRLAWNRAYNERMKQTVSGH